MHNDRPTLAPRGIKHPKYLDIYPNRWCIKVLLVDLDNHPKQPEQPSKITGSCLGWVGADLDFYPKPLDIGPNCRPVELGTDW